MKIRKIYNKALAAFLAFSMVFSMSAITYASDNGEFTIKIVHTNDIHARVQENERSGIIGAERLGGIIDSFTEGADMDLVLDSGDLFHGQPIATLTEGESIARLVKECGYDAMTAGNHDWSYGKDRLKELCGIAGLTMITGNVVETETENRFFDEEFYIEDVTVDGKELKVGIFGVIDPKIKKSTSPSNVEGLEFTDTAEYANEAARQLKEQDCDIVIALAHTYAPCELAEKVSGVDLWLVGHEHIQINEEVTDAAGKSVQVVESGYYLYSMSLIEISGTLDDDGNAENISISVNQIAYDEAKEAPKKEQVSTVLSEINAEQEQKLSEKVGTTPVTLNGIWEDLRIDQQNLGNVVADAYLLETGADVAFENAGGIRASIEAGDVTYGDIIGVSPYGNYIVTKEVTGAELKEIMETSLDIQLQCIEANNSGEYDAWPQSSGSYLQFGGMTVTFNPNAEKGNRILAIYIRDAFLNQEYMPDAEEYYTVATNNYVAVSSYYPQLADKEETGQFSSCDEALVRFFEQDEDKIAGSINSVRLFRRTPGAEWTSGGDGTKINPYLIPDALALKELSVNVNAGNDYSGAYFKMTEDIDLSSVCGENIDGNEVSWERIGTSKTPFSAVFDGNGHKISGLYINEPTGNYRALFGYVKNGVIKNLTVSGEVSGSNFTGGIVGWLYSGSTIENCISNVSVTGAMGTYHTLEKAGGIVGYNCGNVIGCQNKGYVKTADYEDSKSAVGGIAGLNGIDGVIKNCINSGQIYGYTNAGGIVGDTFNSDTVISCINFGLISSKSSSGGIIGTPGKTSKDCYYLEGTAYGGTDDGAQEKTAAEFADGSVAYLLQSVQTGGSMVWGQTLDAESADSYPVLTNNNEKTVYKVTFVSNNAEYSASYANPNKTVTLPDAPKVSGYTFVKWAKTNVSDGEEFTAETPVTENVTVYAITKKRSSGGGSSVSIKPTQPQNTEQPSTTPTVDDKPSNIKVFADVSEDAWYYNSVKYVSENGLMYGVNETDFAPDMSITRAMFVTILYRVENEPDMSNEILGYPFGDVDSESWYTDAVYWACKNGIVNGISNEKFAPNDSITREQMAVILYRYAAYKGLNTNISGKLQYNDNTDISDYAKDAVIWNMDNGIMFGNDDNTFAPLSNTTRAQAAAVFVRMTELDR